MTTVYVCDTTIGEELREPLVHEGNQGRWGRVYMRKGQEERH